MARYFEGPKSLSVSVWTPGVVTGKQIDEQIYRRTNIVTSFLRNLLKLEDLLRKVVPDGWKVGNLGYKKGGKKSRDSIHCPLC